MAALKILFFSLTLFSLNGVIRRDDVLDSSYIEFGNSALFSSVGIVRGLVTNATGTLIDPYTVLTAAHIIQNDGEELLFELYNPEEESAISIQGRAQIHHDFKYTKTADGYIKELHNDLALIHLSSPIYFATPATIDYEKKLLPISFISAGFGKTRKRSETHLLFDMQKRGFTGQISSHFSKNWCDESYISYFDPPYSIKSTPLEAIGAEGDSGSPVFWVNEGEAHLFGVITILSGKGNYGSFNLIAPLDSHKEWIEKNSHF
ncbi:MAG: S1 family peptidase [Chlamydiae bacterium]|nr:S1 family peptidase [Chlamydiota bacterium]